MFHRPAVDRTYYNFVNDFCRQLVCDPATQALGQSVPVEFHLLRHDLAADRQMFGSSERHFVGPVLANVH